MKSGSYWSLSAYTPAARTKFFPDLVTEMPTVFTSFGRRPSTCDTRFCTSTAATSMLRLTSKVTVTLDDPLLPLDEVMYCIPSTPLIACSIGCVTADLDDLGARALIERVDAHRRRRQLRELRDRQRRNRDGAGEDDHQRAHARQDRPSDEGVYNHRTLGTAGLQGWELGAGGAGVWRHLAAVQRRAPARPARRRRASARRR